jgi:drug/metabolite transporter (DMT)-like permease
MTRQGGPRLPASPALPVVATGAVVVAAFCWGLSAIFAKGAFERGIAPASMAEARIAVAGILLLGFLAFVRRDLLRPPRASLLPGGVFGLSLVLVNLSYYVAIDRLPVGVAIALQYTAPVVVLAVTAMVGGNPPRALVWLAGVLTLAGAVLVSGAYAGFGGVDGLGLLAGFGSAVSFAMYLLSAEAAGRRGAHPASVLAVGFVVAALIWSVVLPWWTWPYDRLADPEVALRVIGVGVVGTLLPFLLVLAALRVISSALAGIAATFEPVFASALAFALLGQALSVPQLVGGALVVAGVVLAQTHRAEPLESVPVEVAS